MKAFVIVLFVIFGMETARVPVLDEKLTAEELQYYFGTDQLEEVPEYEFTEPEPVSRVREKRSERLGSKSPVEYRLRAFGQEYHLLLHKNEHLLAKGCSLYNYSTDDSIEISPCPQGREPCYFMGEVRNHASSRVSVSTCNGLHGIIKLSDAMFVVQPIRAQDRHSFVGNGSHIVYRKPLHSKTDVQKLAVSRSKRSQAIHFLEAMIVADTETFSFHGNDTHRFVTTVMNIVSSLFQDDSLGRNKIVVSVVKIKVLKKPQVNLNVNSDVGRSLKSFCRWQNNLNSKRDTGTLHADLSVLISRRAFVKGSNHNIVANTMYGAMCSDSTRSCIIAKDRGLETAFSIAHDTGHTLGLVHDDDYPACRDSGNIMMADSSNTPSMFHWSKCSYWDLTRFLRSRGASCLLDLPAWTEDFPVVHDRAQPGEMYDANEQCALIMGPHHASCQGHGQCSQLMCQDHIATSSCTIHGPKADGSSCGTRKWCMMGHCIDIPADKRPVQGGWSTWIDNSCSRTCGGGIQISLRYCNNPRPLFGGTCSGESSRVRLCNTQSCFSYPEPGCSNRRRQDSNTCNCGHGTHDGSSCFPPGSSIKHSRCYKGKCRVFGCDGILDSGLVYDKCHQCNGIGNTCRRVSGSYKTPGSRKNIVLKLPMRATSMKVFNRNIFRTHTYLGVRVNGSQVISGAAYVTQDVQHYQYKDVHVVYSMSYDSAGLETIEIQGPVTESVHIQAWYQRSGYTPNISYEYYLPLHHS